jgi:hypothetical protein
VAEIIGKIFRVQAFGLILGPMWGGGGSKPFYIGEILEKGQFSEEKPKISTYPYFSLILTKTLEFVKMAKIG